VQGEPRIAAGLYALALVPIIAIGDGAFPKDHVQAGAPDA
jgi:hypothetical protein